MAEPQDAPSASQLAGEQAIRDRTEVERARALEAVPDDAEPEFTARMSDAITRQWEATLEQRLADYREALRRHEQEIQAAKEAALESEKIRKEEEVRAQAAIDTAAKFRELLQLPSGKETDESSTGKVIEMAQGRSTVGPITAWMPSASTIKKIRNGDYTIEL
ncbi:unnamed protein product [Tilletia controversa]|nr:hypothetical protein CF328_g7197 [Tilletia controversa]CAD6957693.1 unnamed protein product [Tilletia controversa]CAD6975257.1 unnamed protein product [Tilletia controversa]